MMRRNEIRRGTALGAGLALAGLAVAVLSGGTSHGAAFVSFTGGRSGDQHTGNTARGFRFTTSSPLVLTHLGVYDVGGNGLNQEHSVGLWDASHALVADVTVPAGTSAALSDGFRYVALDEAVTLSAGTYTLGAYYFTINPTSGDLYVELANSVSLPDGVTFDTALWGSSSLFPPSRPPNEIVGLSYFGPGALYTPVPEGAYWGLGSACLLVGVGLIRRVAR